CSCSVAATIVSQGLFPCAPIRPSLAVDMNMLEFVHELSMRSAPNITAWTGTLEAFLRRRDFRLDSKDSLRRRFANAFQWYQYTMD
ncbi:hypothetical protein FISHEDRAFT_27778, partial [Fistulina hepatica ATCC 64428]